MLIVRLAGRPESACSPATPVVEEVELETVDAAAEETEEKEVAALASAASAAAAAPSSAAVATALAAAVAASGVHPTCRPLPALPGLLSLARSPLPALRPCAAVCAVGHSAHHASPSRYVLFTVATAKFLPM